MKRCSFVILITLFAAPALMAQKIVDLSRLKFTENADQLLTGIPAEKTVEKDAVHYNIKNPKNCPYDGVVMESEVTVGAYQHTVISYLASTNLTANTNRVMKSVLAKYGQPTKKITNSGDTRAWYWQTPTLFIQLMTTEVGFHDKRGKQISGKLQIVTLKGLKTGAEPDLAQVYSVFSTYKI